MNSESERMKKFSDQKYDNTMYHNIKIYNIVICRVHNKIFGGNEHTKQLLETLMKMINAFKIIKIYALSNKQNNAFLCTYTNKLSMVWKYMASHHTN